MNVSFVNQRQKFRLRLAAGVDIQSASQLQDESQTPSDLNNLHGFHLFSAESPGFVSDTNRRCAYDEL
jgi:hypothetical protein